jgi:hypothetical protein
LVYYSGKARISISSREAMCLPLVDAKVREPVSERPILFLQLCVTHLDGQHYPTVCYSALSE